ncbi:lytic transglycosylase domain-containing protein [Patulibacter sp.]|uniref:lytic transglycosylase domain-containing protein n=1 Tax=Patulibacter sp. TaxID=1912859 RepID=UPI0027271EF6|nr:transglycosylase SLT domain-containing protein [Patulibacter sp.]MDO9409525.1 transglycosylase SLT domain-containing protein [Patulibacter sp.]
MPSLRALVLRPEPVDDTGLAPGDRPGPASTEHPGPGLGDRPGPASTAHAAPVPDDQSRPDAAEGRDRIAGPGAETPDPTDEDGRTHRPGQGLRRRLRGGAGGAAGDEGRPRDVRAGRTVRRPGGRSVDRPEEHPRGLAVVLAPADRALVAGAAVAAAAARSRRSAAPVLALWDPRGGWPSAEGTTSTAGARRTAVHAASCGVEAVAVGRTVRVELPADDVQAVAAAERLERADGLGPVVLVIAGPWGAPFLAPIERAGLVHADGGPAALAACGRTLCRHGVEVARVPVPTGPVARVLLRAGWVGRSQVRVRAAEDAGQSLPMILGALLLALVLAGVLGAVASAMGGREDRQRAVDLAALAAADRMRTDWPSRAGSPPTIGVDRYRDRAIEAARRAATSNGLSGVRVTFPDPVADEAGPLTVRVRAPGSTAVAGVDLGTSVEATAELSPPALPVDVTSGDEYDGPLSRRQGKPMRPDVALAFDRMNAAATAAGHPLSVTSGFRSNAEQARLFAAHPDPKWVARPGTSLHRLGTELDLGPNGAYGWLAANAMRFGFKKRYSWEPWHFGFVRETGSSHVAEQGRNPKAPASSGALPAWTPARFRPTILAASIRFKVSAALLAAQLKQESGFDPGARSPAGAQGIAQFMPGTARAMGLRDPFDPEQAIPAQARLMSLLLRRFGSVQLALAAYNAGEGNVAPCGCVPPFPETRHYVATIVALMKGYDPAGGLADVLSIRLVR